MDGANYRPLAWLAQLKKEAALEEKVRMEEIKESLPGGIADDSDEDNLSLDSSHKRHRRALNHKARRRSGWH